MQKTIESEILKYRPLVFRCDSAGDMQALETLKSDRNPLILNTLDIQIADLLPCLYPADFFSGISLSQLRERWLNGRELNTVGNWVYFSWKNALVRLLPKEEFVLCRTNRNKFKVREEIQESLQHKSILFIGLSVGQSAAVTYALQRTCGIMHLADFDTLSLSNLNRLRASVLDISLPKTIVAARAIAELDPYIEVHCHHEGVTFENIDDLLTQSGKGPVDLVVEECDSLDIKFKTRESARRLKIPVIMETSDRGMLDVERFDEVEELNIFHGLSGELNAEQIKDLTPQEKFGVLQKIVDYASISDSLKISYAAVGTQVVSWPQLASEVTLGGASLTYCGNKILSGQPMKSGRYYIDLEAILTQKDES